MSSFLDIRLPQKSISTRRSDDYSELLRRAADPNVELRRFESGLHEDVTRRAHELGVHDHEEVRFAIDVMLRSRLRGARQHLIREAVDKDALSDYLQCSREIGREQAGASNSAEGLADAVTGVLDGFHSYLIAHNLVDDGYLNAERAAAARLLSGTVSNAAGVAPAGAGVAPAGARQVAHGAAMNELALAA